MFMVVSHEAQFVMNSTITFPSPEPTLKLPRAAEKWAATLAEERRRLQEDHEALRSREENLREYETRLRALQAEIEAGRAAAVAAAPAPAPAPVRVTQVPFHRTPSGTPFADEAALHAAWEKLHRARELFEAEQTHMREDRILIHDKMETIKRRETELSEREARLAER